jgi:hypothetical protein
MAIGKGFAPGQRIVMHWSPGIGEFTATATNDGTFEVPIQVANNDVTGVRALTIVGDATAAAQYLVFPSTMRPAGARTKVRFGR